MKLALLTAVHRLVVSLHICSCLSLVCFCSCQTAATPVTWSVRVRSSWTAIKETERRKKPHLPEDTAPPQLLNTRWAFKIHIILHIGISKARGGIPGVLRRSIMVYYVESVLCVGVCGRGVRESGLISKPTLLHNLPPLSQQPVPPPWLSA